ncbi:HK97 family phage prohead protease [Weissella muntiaci]|uniref:HK97 family phage prohead protease n=1 Tax=Weissella muntiaci TaxID=2508881 RepID=A0A6C2CAT5_9LACO|nr:HK97 family phage prohead protease [Weissella muntiaci]TYC50726.1 HK97 family phage prohead protease [Weissella muntiaci]
MSDEKRTVELTDIEIRSAPADGFVGQVAGYAIVWDTPSTNLPFVEIIQDGALNDVDLSKTLALYNHDFANVLGRVDAGTLVLNIDKKGLAFTLDIPDTQLGRDVYTQIKNGNLKGLSFRYSIGPNGEQWKEVDGVATRLISNIETMREISIVSVPAYDDTNIEITRSFEQFTKSQEYKQKIALVLSTY